MASDNPDLQTKAADVIGLYIPPPQHAAVFCVDEETAIQALGRLDPMLPSSPGRMEWLGLEFNRNGTLANSCAMSALPPRRSAFQMEIHRCSAEFSHSNELIATGH